MLATCSSYAYADEQTVTMIAARLGLADNHCVRISQNVDAMFICSTAYLVQSRCGRVAILCYRGTEPVNFINWLTDTDVTPEKLSFPAAGGGPSFTVHAGFYRNVRSTRFEVVAMLQRALRGESILAKGGSMPHPLEALYVTGHSLGAAMAAMMGTMLVMEETYAPIADRLRAVYTYGQPMIGNPALAEACAKDKFLGRQVFRYIYGHNVVAELPPTASGDFAHFGRELRYEGGRWAESDKPTAQLSNLLELPGAAAAFVAHQLRWLRNMPFQHSLYDHEPQHYIAALTPPGVQSEFGN